MRDAAMNKRIAAHRMLCCHGSARWGIGLVAGAALLLAACGGASPKSDDLRADPEREAQSPASAVTVPPGPVLVLGTVTANGAEFTWTAPQTTLTITGYVVQWRVASEHDWSNAASDTTAASATSQSIGGMRAATAYLVRVRAEAGEIDGDWSEDLELTTSGGGNGNPTTVPAPAVTVRSRTDTSLTIDWTAPATTLTITGYHVWWRTGSGNWTERNDLAAGARTHDMTGLAAGTTYDVRVRAVTASVTGNWGTTRVATTGGPGSAVPVVTIHRLHDATVPFSGGGVLFLVDADEQVTARVEISVSVTAPDYVLAEHQGTRTVTINAAGSTGVITVPWDGEATPPASDGTVTVTLQSGTGYTLGIPASARITIAHDK